MLVKQNKTTTKFSITSKETALETKYLGRLAWH